MPMDIDKDPTGTGAGSAFTSIGAIARTNALAKITHSDLLNPEFLSGDVLKELLIERGYTFPNPGPTHAANHHQSKDELLVIYRSLVLPKPQRTYSTKRRFERKLAQNQSQLGRESRNQHKSPATATDTPAQALTINNQHHLQINGLKRPFPGQGTVQKSEIDVPLKKTKNEITWP